VHDALVAANAVVARQLAADGPLALQLRLEVAALADEHALLRHVAGAGALRAALLVLERLRTVAADAPSGVGDATEGPVAGAGGGQLAVDAVELRLLGHVAHDG